MVPWPAARPLPPELAARPALRLWLHHRIPVPQHRPDPLDRRADHGRLRSRLPHSARDADLRQHGCCHPPSAARRNRSASCELGVHPPLLLWRHHRNPWHPAHSPGRAAPEDLRHGGRSDHRSAATVRAADARASVPPSRFAHLGPARRTATSSNASGRTAGRS